jgi:hypothetical protein
MAQLLAQLLCLSALSGVTDVAVAASLWGAAGSSSSASDMSACVPWCVLACLQLEVLNTLERNDPDAKRCVGTSSSSGCQRQQWQWRQQQLLVLSLQQQGLSAAAAAGAPPAMYIVLGVAYKRQAVRCSHVAWLPDVFNRLTVLLLSFWLLPQALRQAQGVVPVQGPRLHGKRCCHQQLCFIPALFRIEAAAARFTAICTCMHTQPPSSCCICVLCMFLHCCVITAAHNRLLFVLCCTHTGV